MLAGSYVFCSGRSPCALMEENDDLLACNTHRQTRQKSMISNQNHGYNFLNNYGNIL